MLTRIIKNQPIFLDTRHAAQHLVYQENEQCPVVQEPKPIYGENLSREETCWVALGDFLQENKGIYQQLYQLGALNNKVGEHNLFNVWVFWRCKRVAKIWYQDVSQVNDHKLGEYKMHFQTRPNISNTISSWLSWDTIHNFCVPWLFHDTPIIC